MKGFKSITVFFVVMSLCFSGWTAEVNSPQSSAAVSQRKIRSGDTLNITVWQHKDLSASVVVDESGNIEYLFMGVIPVSGKTVSELKESLRKGISDNYIVDPRIDITLDRKSITFFMTGEVQKSGTYEFSPGLTVLQAIAMAGGFTDYASRKVKVIRKTEEGKEKEIKIDTVKLLRATDRRAESQLQVDDIIVAERAWW